MAATRRLERRAVRRGGSSPSKVTKGEIMIVPLIEGLIDLGVPIIGIDLGEYCVCVREEKYHISREVEVDDPYENNYYTNVGSCDTPIEVYDMIRKDKEKRQ